MFFLVRWYIPREIWQAMDTSSWEVNIYRSTYYSHVHVPPPPMYKYPPCTCTPHVQIWNTCNTHTLTKLPLFGSLVLSSSDLRVPCIVFGKRSMGCSVSLAWQARSWRRRRWGTWRKTEPPSIRDLTTMSGGVVCVCVSVWECMCIL